MSMHHRSKRLPEIYGKYQFDPRFRTACSTIAKAVYGMSEQDARDALLMAEKLNHWQSLDGSGRFLLDIYRDERNERDSVIRGVQ